MARLAFSGAIGRGWTPIPGRREWRGPATGVVPVQHRVSAGDGRGLRSMRAQSGLPGCSGDTHSRRRPNSDPVGRARMMNPSTARRKSLVGRKSDPELSGPVSPSLPPGYRRSAPRPLNRHTGGTRSWLSYREIKSNSVATSSRLRPGGGTRIDQYRSTCGGAGIWKSVLPKFCCSAAFQEPSLIIDSIASLILSRDSVSPFFNPIP